MTVKSRGVGKCANTPYRCCVALGFSGSGYVGLMPVVLLDNIALEWSCQGLPAVNDVLADYSKLAPKMTTPRKGDYPHYRDSQLGKACCIDPLVGQYKANRAGLGNLLRREHIRTALRAVLRYNFQRTLNQHYSYGRRGWRRHGNLPARGEAEPAVPIPVRVLDRAGVCLRTPAAGLRLQTRGAAGRASHSCPTRWRKTQPVQRTRVRQLLRPQYVGLVAGGR
jgi:hypothetical protein